MKKLTQEQIVLRHLRKKGARGITSMEAFRLYGITRLSGRIFDLKEEGYVIDSERISKKNENGASVTFAKYTLIKDKDEAKK